MLFRSTRRPRLELLEDRVVPAGFFLTGVGSNTIPAEPFARIYDASAPGDTSNVVAPPGSIDAFPGFAGSVRMAGGDVNGDGVDDIICAQGPGTGSGSQVRIFDGAAAFAGTVVELASFFAYLNVPGAGTVPGFGGGVFVAATDFNGDGFDELVTSPGLVARGHVKMFDFNDGAGGFLGSAPALRASFFAYTDFAGEIRLTTMTHAITGVETPYLVTASGAGTSPCDVRLYGDAYNIGQVPDLTFVQPAVQFFPFAGYAGGISVAAGDTDGDGDDELFVSKNDGVSTVFVYDIDAIAAPQASFTAFEGFLGEVRIGAADVNGDGQVEVLTSTGSSPGADGSHVKAWTINGPNTATLRSFFAYQGYVGGVWLSGNDLGRTQTFASLDTPATIPDGGLLTERSTITVTPLLLDDSALTARSILVDLVITSTAGGQNDELVVALEAPDGTQLVLFSNINGNGAGFNVTLSDDGATNINSAGPGFPLMGTFRPEGGAALMAVLGNVPIGGDWSLFIQDDTGGGSDTYELTSWALTFVY